MGTSEQRGRLPVPSPAPPPPLPSAEASSLQDEATGPPGLRESRCVVFPPSEGLSVVFKMIAQLENPRRRVSGVVWILVSVSFLSPNCSLVHLHKF